MSKLRSVLPFLAVQALSAGCYSYSTVEPATQPPGSTVRVRLTAPSAARIAPSLGNGSARVLTGQVVSAAPGALTIEVPTVPMGTATAQQGLFQRVTLAPADILETERRTLDGRRTGLLIGGAVAVAATAVVLVINGQSSGSSATNEPPPNFLRRPIILFRF